MVQLNDKLARCKQKQTSLKQKYKALCHIHKSSLIELYNLAIQESNSLRNDISILNNVIQKLNEELSRYETDPKHSVKDIPSSVHVTKLTNLQEVHIFEPLMKSYETLLNDRNLLLDKYKQETAQLRNQVKSTEDENHSLRKMLRESESHAVINEHKMESLSINRDLLAEQNEVGT
ncbi:hypothetical protein WDU94_000395 [Cyamophila willieti]